MEALLSRDDGVEINNSSSASVFICSTGHGWTGCSIDIVWRLRTINTMNYYSSREYNTWTINQAAHIEQYDWCTVLHYLQLYVQAQAYHQHAAGNTVVRVPVAKRFGVGGYSGRRTPLSKILYCSNDFLMALGSVLYYHTGTGTRANERA